ncbi:MAG: DNA mismatch repair protein MutS [Proteobacteria bacterium]|nr:DNA mismatch repair protein MutS [Pseudomonadota bacterium]
MEYQSILFQTITDRDPDERLSPPDFFVDLALDQVVAAITAGKEEYDLKPFFYLPLNNVDAISFRHEIMRDLEDSPLFDSIKTFAETMRTMREHLAQEEKLSYKRQKERWFLDAVDIYCDAVTCLVRDFSRTECTSRGLVAFREYMTRYVSSERFNPLLEHTKKLKADLASIRYCMNINGLLVQGSKYEGESDYSAEVEATFERFKQGAVEEYAFKFSDSPSMNHVEASILDLVVQLYPDIFSALESYCAIYKDFRDSMIVTFDREIQFYIAWLEHITLFRKAGLSFCYPHISHISKEVYNYQGFDLALAGKLISEQVTPVYNDFHLKDRERIIVVSGPNQGGKTTFARTFGQLHYLASLGCPIPGTKAQLYLFDSLFTHFEREEHSANLRGKLQDDLVRIHAILSGATPESIVIINEIFASTTFRDASDLSRMIAAKIIELDMLCVWVTFVDELSTLGEKTVSMVSTVVPENPALRTYKLIRRPADGLAYALSIAEKYRLTYDMIKERIAS